MTLSLVDAEITLDIEGNTTVSEVELLDSTFRLKALWETYRELVAESAKNASFGDTAEITNLSLEMMGVGARN